MKAKFYLANLVIHCGQGGNDDDEVDHQGGGRVGVHLQWSLG